MAIVKANYVKRGQGSRGRAKATIRYIQDRPGNKREKLTRTLFGSDGSLTREQAYRMIDEAAQDTLFYRLIISPDPRREDNLRDLNLSELTKQTIIELENRLKTQILFAAALHDDHPPPQARPCPRAYKAEALPGGYRFSPQQCDTDHSFPKAHPRSGA